MIDGHKQVMTLAGRLDNFNTMPVLTREESEKGGDEEDSRQLAVEQRRKRTKLTKTINIIVHQ
jgi:hypothetical protein